MTNGSYYTAICGPRGTETLALGLWKELYPHGFAEYDARIGIDTLISETGNRLLPGFTAPKLLWMREHEPELFAQIDKVLLPKDYIRYRLTGELAMDVSDASGTSVFGPGCWGRLNTMMDRTSRLRPSRLPIRPPWPNGCRQW